MSHPLDHPQWAALTSVHAHRARRAGRAAAYPADIAAMSGLEDIDDPAAWGDLAGLLGDGAVTILINARQPRLPPEVRPIVRRQLLQMQGPVTAPALGETPEGLVSLGEADGPEMVALAAATEPGPMLPRTVTMGDYWGVRRDGRLVAMAGQRLHLTGWTEISGVCADPAFRGQGLARHLVSRLTRSILERGERAFLHSELANASAIALYESLGYETRAEMSLSVVRITRR
jgi:GNAT superfamily N-acetyltransferase